MGGADLGQTIRRADADIDVSVRGGKNRRRLFDPTLDVGRCADILMRLHATWGRWGGAVSGERAQTYTSRNSVHNYADGGGEWPRTTGKRRRLSSTNNIPSIFVYQTDDASLTRFRRHEHRYNYQYAMINECVCVCMCRKSITCRYDIMYNQCIAEIRLF